MANYTENYNLIMPAQEDYYNVQEFNDNMEAIDTGMAELEAEVNGLSAKLDEMNTKLALLTTMNTKLTSLDEKIGTLEDAAGTNTLYGMLKKNPQVFKSWKRYTYSNTDPTTTVEIPIQEVDASRSFVLVERTCNSYNQLAEYSYILEDTKIRLFHRTASTGYLKLAFTVIELY